MGTKFVPKTAEITWYLHHKPDEWGGWQLGSISLSGVLVRSDGTPTTLPASDRWFELDRIPQDLRDLIDRHNPDPKSRSSRT